MHFPGSASIPGTRSLESPAEPPPTDPVARAENQRSRALMGADFDDSALTVGHLRWVCWHYF